MNAGSVEPIVIIGGGAAGHACAEAYRRAGGSDPVVIISNEDRLPYFRPDLSKDVLAGEKNAADDLAEQSWFADHDVTVRLGTTVSRIDTERRTIVLAASDHQAPETIAWSQCLLAPGSSATRLPVPGGDDDRLLTIRGAADVERVIAASAHGSSVVIVGSGFIGCEAASSLRSRGLEVTMLSLEIQPQQDRLSDVVGELINGLLARAGVEFHGGETVEAFEFSDDSATVVAGGGHRFAADHILVASGAKTNTAVAEASGLEIVAGGVHVDSSMRSNVEGLFVAGDLAYADNVTAGRALRVEHWGDAETMGSIAGRVMAGEAAVWESVPGFWSTINGETLQYIAWGDGWDEVAARRSEEGLSVWYAKHGTIVGVLTHRHDDDQELGKTLISTGAALADLHW